LALASRWISSNNQAPAALGLILKVDVGSGIQTEIELRRTLGPVQDRLVWAHQDILGCLFTSHFRRMLPFLISSLRPSPYSPVV